ncbi:MAG: aminoacyl-tRNA hydrolase [Oscillospiraceae bacterium]|nr:aminoacyl-tRNA hydrolase [Oscillospiraceae bacterium]
MHLIIGLGNPGTKYVNTRHNIGFDIVDFLAQSEAAPKKSGIFSRNKSDFKSKHRAQVCESRIAGKKVILAKPQTFMNLSGESVAALAKFYKIENENIIVIYDDIDLPLGKLRLRPGGGSGGHNGIKSIISHIGEDFSRVRIGIGADKHENFDTADYVLGKFTKKETEILIQTAKTATEAIEAIVKSGINAAMNAYN